MNARTVFFPRFILFVILIILLIAAVFPPQFHAHAATGMNAKLFDSVILSNLRNTVKCWEAIYLSANQYIFIY